MRRIKIAEEEEEQQQMKQTNEVRQWLSSVQAVETEVDELIKQASEEIERLHPGGFCTRTFNSLSSSYEMEDMVADKLQAVTNLIKEGAFLVAADEVPVVTTLIDEGAPEVTLPEDVADDDQFTIVGMESMINEVLRCLKKEEYVGIIGVYGMGGVGKTTLLKQINKKLDLEMKNDFDVVIWVVVSRDLQLDKIQQQIGKKIGLFDNKVWKHKNFEEKASDIFKILKEKKFVLLMDDLWERVDLTKVGVPLPNPENSSKIVFTTRSLQICSLMEAGKLFKVTCLSDEDAWKLFRTSVGDETLHAHPEVPEIARDVSKACYGLPLALVSFGRAMASKKTPQEWSDVLQVLSMSSNSDVKELTIADCPMPPLPPHLLNKVNVTSVVSWTRSPIWKPRDRVKLVKKEKINKEKPEDVFTGCKLPAVTKKSFVGEVKRDSDFKKSQPTPQSTFSVRELIK